MCLALEAHVLVFPDSIQVFPHSIQVLDCNSVALCLPSVRRHFVERDSVSSRSLLVLCTSKEKCAAALLLVAVMISFQSAGSVLFDHQNVLANAPIAIDGQLDL